MGCIFITLSASTGELSPTNCRPSVFASTRDTIPYSRWCRTFGHFRNERYVVHPCQPAPMITIFISSCSYDTMISKWFNIRVIVEMKDIIYWGESDLMKFSLGRVLAAHRAAGWEWYLRGVDIFEKFDLIQTCEAWFIDRYDVTLKEIYLITYKASLEFL
jgi:hypothetical protein